MQKIVTQVASKLSDVSDVTPCRVRETITQAINSRDLLAGRRVLVIRHGPEEYRLRLTRSGKLILTK